MQTSEEDIHTKKINFCVVGELIFFFSPQRYQQRVDSYRAHDE